MVTYQCPPSLDDHWMRAPWPGSEKDACHQGENWGEGVDVGNPLHRTEMLPFLIWWHWSVLQSSFWSPPSLFLWPASSGFVLVDPPSRVEPGRPDILPWLWAALSTLEGPLEAWTCWSGDACRRCAWCRCSLTEKVEILQNWVWIMLPTFVMQKSTFLQLASVFSVELVCKEELNLMLKVSRLLVKVQWFWAKRHWFPSYQYLDLTERIKKC